MSRKARPMRLGGALILAGCLASMTAPGATDTSPTTGCGRGGGLRLADIPLTGPVIANGSAALHEHVMAEHAFSGKWHWGRVDGPAASSMRVCDGNGDTHAGANGVCSAAAWLGGEGNSMGRDTCCHGGGPFDCNYKATNGGDPDPYWAWLDWPKWDTKAHPQYHWENLLQARKSGLSLMVVQAVENYVLCSKINEHIRSHPFRGAGYPCDHGDSFSSLKLQIKNLRAFVGNHSDFLEIALSPAEARRIIASKKMAIVIGIEADYAWGNERYPIDLLQRLDDYYDLGVRTAYLAHKINTRLAGAALYEKLLWGIQSTANCLFLNIQCGSSIPYAIGNGLNAPARNYYEVSDVTMINRVSDRLGQGPEVWNGFREYPGGGVTAVTERNYAGHAVKVYKNSLGLTLEGQKVTNAMMDKGMLIDISHLSESAIAGVYSISQARSNYPLFASHGQARKMLAHVPLHVDSSLTSYQSAEAEMALSDDALGKIRDTDGVLGHFASPEPTATYRASGVVNNCVRSTRSLAQSLAYAFDLGVKLSWGFDFMGFGGGVAPRNGYSNHANDWCGDNSGECAVFVGGPLGSKGECAGAQYGTGDRGAQGVEQSGHLSDHPVANREAAYFNTRGFGHIGLIGQLHNDLRAIGLRPEIVDMVQKSSAENFIRMWEKADYISRMDAAIIPVL